MRFESKCVVATGAASGIGRATALLFAREGATVFAADIDVQGDEALATEAETITAVGCDVCDPDQIKALMDQAAAACGGIDAMSNPIGYMRGDLDAEPRELAYRQMQRRDRYHPIGRAVHV